MRGRPHHTLRVAGTSKRNVSIMVMHVPTAGQLIHIGQAAMPPRLIILARPGRTVELEFLAVFDEANLEDRLAYVGDQLEAKDGRELPSGCSGIMRRRCITASTTGWMW